jgi:hypothetical protein
MYVRGHVAWGTYICMPHITVQPLISPKSSTKSTTVQVFFLLDDDGGNGGDTCCFFQTNVVITGQSGIVSLTSELDD